MVDFNSLTREKFDSITAKSEIEISYNPVTGKREDYIYNPTTNTYMLFSIDNEEEDSYDFYEYAMSEGWCMDNIEKD